MKFEKTEVWGFTHAIRGMRNPMNSWSKSDTENNVIGKNDLELMKKLISAGSEHRKFLRQIFVSVDITAPLYWWKEFDTYKIGTTSNSCSTMHKLAQTEIKSNCFEFGFADENTIAFFYGIIDYLEKLRLKYLETKDINYFYNLIKLLPESWLQKRTITLTYENIFNIINQRKNHKLKDWNFNFIDWSKNLPYAMEVFNYDSKR